MIRKTLTVVLPLMVMALISPLRGQVDEVILRVDGLACPFCAYGIKKKLKKLEGARSLEIIINEGKIVMEWNSDSTLDLEAINKAVETAGFTLRGVRASVRGALMSDSGMFYLLTPNTPEQRFYLYESAEITRPTFSEKESHILVTEATRNRLRQLLLHASVVRIAGSLHEEMHLDRGIGLEIEILEEVSS